MSLEAPFLRSVVLMRDRIENPDVYPFSLPAVQAVDRLELSAVTYFIGENGSGKSTILEAIAVACGFNAEGGSINFTFKTRRSGVTTARVHSLHSTSEAPTDGFLPPGGELFQPSHRDRTPRRRPGPQHSTMSSKASSRAYFAAFPSGKDRWSQYRGLEGKAR